MLKYNMYKEIRELNRLGLTNEQIMEKMLVTRKQVLNCLGKVGLLSNRYEIIEEDENFRQFIYGSMLGDGYICPHPNTQASRISFGHCDKQKEYIDWKHDFLLNYDLALDVYPYMHISNRYKNGVYIGHQFKSKKHPLFTKYRDLFYPNNKKIFNIKTLKKLNPLGLAIWYMDDGSVTANSGQLATNSCNFEETQFLRKILKDNFNINTTYHTLKNGQYYIYILKESFPTLVNIIKPYIIPTMEYKLTPYKDKSPA